MSSPPMGSGFPPVQGLRGCSPPARRSDAGRGPVLPSLLLAELLGSGILLGAGFYHYSAVARGFLAEANVNAALKCSHQEEALYPVYSGDKCR